ncbi:hypothetical protein [Actinoplanes teichomyceticus]|uniref:Lipoprotein n=1 Tax=Actinoplanes teichomyceticus TaxID=1867 RepID=A0A561WS49_ACTTI|nr:hypothetical protein [Actinoplanes teichomyceticus]TWG26701.1 hypothetical protein FHX34_1011697 [Actinoplanes teichomyceticus]GIF15101.1 hypothetical protein Ate01nite_51330 [Actinoplanes teichomyceticus]
MRSHHTFRVGIAMAAGTLAAGCGASSGAPSPAPSAPAPVTSTTGSPAATGPSSAATGPSSAATAASQRPESSSPAPLPTLTNPAKPPREPTDNLPDNGWVAGMVTRGGSGPCYGLTADDGTRYALYSTEGIKLTAGDRVKVKVETTLLKIYCGPGRLMAMTEAQPIG